MTFRRTVNGNDSGIGANDCYSQIKNRRLANMRFVAGLQTACVKTNEHVSRIRDCPRSPIPPPLASPVALRQCTRTVAALAPADGRGGAVGVCVWGGGGSASRLYIRVSVVCLYNIGIYLYLSWITYIGIYQGSLLQVRRCCTPQCAPECAPASPPPPAYARSAAPGQCVLLASGADP